MSTTTVSLPEELRPVFHALVRLLNGEKLVIGEVLGLDVTSRALYLLTAVKLSPYYLIRPTFSYQQQATSEPLVEALSWTMVCELNRDRHILEDLVAELHGGGYIASVDRLERATFAHTPEVAELRCALAYQEEGVDVSFRDADASEGSATTGCARSAG